MEGSITGNSPNNGQMLADMATDEVQGASRDAAEQEHPVTALMVAAASGALLLDLLKLLRLSRD